ncbi:hypothetical protein BGW36DRAFT_406644 [Talaromyces proteolyticus]|uniref:BTB domain-containing protein n=1 Tax=Talaromyces proteolyticus TaxID=1131652 RepID=A0AAD4Q1I2_9EURO|nr:uncharacterized protein BGW36DRAFT_406644 [Talaromyces proteolyticus]KAH8698744.1 hypothetical protein BGW36DRAFT_406644 [Talaromyces proteolyticus]
MNGFYWVWPETPPQTSPYTSRFITLRIGKSSNEYKVPEDFIQKYPNLSAKIRNFSSADEIPCLDDIDSEIGHTFVHFLYSGACETLGEKRNVWPEERNAEKYRHSILIYSAAVKYDIWGLVKLAKAQIRQMSANLPLSSLISNARELVDVLPNGDTWFLKFLRNKVLQAHEDNEDIFTRRGFFKGFGKHETLDPFLCQCIVEAYQNKVAKLKEQAQKAIGESIQEDSMSKEILLVEEEVNEDIPEPHNDDIGQAEETSSPTEAMKEPLGVKHGMSQIIPSENYATTLCPKEIQRPEEHMAEEFAQEDGVWDTMDASSLRKKDKKKGRKKSALLNVKENHASNGSDEW